MDPYVSSLLNWQKQCFSWHFKSIIRRGIEDRIDALSIEAEAYKLAIQGDDQSLIKLMDPEQKIKMIGMQVDTLKTVLKGVDAIPDCEQKGV